MAAAVTMKNPHEKGDYARLKPSKLTAALKLLFKTKRSAMIWGPPGGGKSSIVDQVRKALGIQLLDIRLVLWDEVDLRGVPGVENGKTKWAVPAVFPTSGKGIMLLDEINSARPGVQAAAYQLILDRKLGDYVLPEGWVVMAAGNRDEDGSVTYRMPTALRNRMVHLELETDLDDWIAWAIPADIHPLVQAFIRWRPQLLHDFRKDARAFATPRAWEFVSDIMKQEPDPSIEYELYEGTVGPGAAVELMAFLKLYRELPDIDDIIAKPKSSMIPVKPSAVYAVVSALARRATKDNLSKIITYIDRLPEEFAMMCIRTVSQRDRKILTDAGQTFLDFIYKHQDINF